MSSPRIALITGANRGIGEATLRQLSDRGFTVVVTARDAAAGQPIASHVTADTGHPTVFIELDVASDDSIQQAAKQFGEQFDHLDVLINNAGIYPDDDLSILDVDGTKLMHTLTTNTLGPLLVARFFRPYLEASPGGGRIINLSSGLGQLHDMDDQAPTYSISKTALNAVTRQLASALQPKNIAVNCVCPGWVQTDMGGDSAPRSVEEGADTVVWLAAEAPQSITGQFLRDRKPIPW